MPPDKHLNPGADSPDTVNYLEGELALGEIIQFPQDRFRRRVNRREPATVTDIAIARRAARIAELRAEYDAVRAAHGKGPARRVIRREAL